MGTVRDDMTLALRLAEKADALTLGRFGAMDLQVDTKPDLTPVTDADRSVESALRDTLAAERPGDSVLGEEYGGTAAFTGRQWVIDPIDGTKNFVRGVPIWATLIALMSDGVPVVGAVSAPALQRRWWAGADEGAFAAVSGGSPKPVSVSSVAEIGPSSTCGTGSSTSPTPFGGYAATATSCPTAWWPREPSTSPQNPRYRCGTSARSTSWCARPAGPLPASTGPRDRTAATLWPPMDGSTMRC